MAQSLWTTDIGKKFKRFEIAMLKEYQSYSKVELIEKIEKLNRGFQKLCDTAEAEGFQTPERKVYPWDRQDITWIKINSLDGKVIGLTEGPTTEVDGKPVFNHIWFRSWFECLPEHMDKPFALEDLIHTAEQIFAEQTNRVMLTTYERFGASPVEEQEIINDMTGGAF